MNEQYLDDFIKAKNRFHLLKNTATMGVSSLVKELFNKKQTFSFILL